MVARRVMVHSVHAVNSKSPANTFSFPINMPHYWRDGVTGPYPRIRCGETFQE